MLRYLASLAATASAVSVLVPAPGGKALAAPACKTAAQKATKACKAAAKRKGPQREGISDEAKWGPLADLVGPVWHTPGVLVSYSWKEPGRVLVASDMVSRAQAEFTLKPDGTIEDIALDSAFDSNRRLRHGRHPPPPKLRPRVMSSPSGRLTSISGSRPFPAMTMITTRIAPATSSRSPSTGTTAAGAMAGVQQRFSIR